MSYIPSFIHLYEEKGSILDVHEIAEYLIEKLPHTKVSVRGNFISDYLNRNKEKQDVINYLAKRLALSRVRNLKDPKRKFQPLYGEIEYERRYLLDPAHKPHGVLYDGFKLQLLLSSLIKEDEQDMAHLHLIFTDQLFGTWDELNKRYHARVSVYGFPSIISTTGVVEAPAKPREFYLLKQSMFGWDDMALIALKERLKERFIDYGDPRLTEVIKGYVMQALFFHMSGEPFCEDKGCRLYNAHWQEEVIWAQIGSGYEFCKRHGEILANLAK